MVSLMQRRREMMKKTAGEPHLVYSLFNRTVTTGEQIKTGVKPFEADTNITILFDMNVTANPTSGAASKFRFLTCYNSGISLDAFRFVKNSTGASYYSIYWMGQNFGTNDLEVSTGRARIVVTHEAGSNTVKTYFKKDNGSIRTKNTAKTFTAATGNVLYLGGTANGQASLPAGVINSVKVYDIILTSDEINAFFA